MHWEVWWFIAGIVTGFLIIVLLFVYLLLKRIRRKSLEVQRKLELSALEGRCRRDRTDIMFGVIQLRGHLR